MASVNIVETMGSVSSRFEKIESILGKGLLEPFNNSSSAARKIMFGSHTEQILPLINPETAFIQTGYEYEYGRYASSFVKAQDDYVVLAKIPKFPHMPDHHYFLLVVNKENELDIIERKIYSHITESYGYLNNTSHLDCLKEGSTINKGSTIVKSKAYDGYDNRQDGINAKVVYIADLFTSDDGFIVSETAANEKFVSPLIDKVMITINDNDIALNLYGDYNSWKSWPNIGEEIRNGILCAIRRHKKEECLFTGSYERMMDILTSDEKINVSGQIIDVNFYCNNPEVINNRNPQLVELFNQSMDFSKRMVMAMKPYIENPMYKRTYEFGKQYLYHERIISGNKWEKDGKSFSNINIEFVTLKYDKLEEGDKLTDRWGGKGVVAKVLPDYLMPKLDNGEIVDIVINPYSVPNRNNPAQSKEVSLTYRSSRIIENFIGCDPDENLEEYLKYISILSSRQEALFARRIKMYQDDEKARFVNMLKEYGAFHLVMEPISESINLETLNFLDRTFPYVEPYSVIISMKGSNGQYRQVPTRRKLVAGHKYMYRLKQYAEDKFSATSLSATNIKNEPTRSKASKIYKSPYPKTPIKFGEMEFGDMLHLNVESVVSMLMLHSSSPQGRRLAEQLFYGNPFDVDIKLTKDCKNRNAEILNAYLKTIGLRIKFTAVPKRITRPITYSVLEYDYSEDAFKSPIYYENEKVDVSFGSNTTETKSESNSPIFYRPIFYFK